jgi:hypothetical protein
MPGNAATEIEVKMLSTEGEDCDVFEDTQRKRRPKPEPTILDPDAETSQKDRQRAESPRRPTTPRKRSIQLVSTAPEIIWLDTESQIEGEDLIDRAGKYDRPTNRLFLNGLYHAVKEKIDTLESQLSQQVDWAAIRGMVVDRVRAEMALHIGSVVIFALAKQGLPTWTEVQWQKALEPETLTVVLTRANICLATFGRRCCALPLLKSRE